MTKIKVFPRNSCRNFVGFLNIVCEILLFFQKEDKIVKYLQFYGWKFVENFVSKAIAFYGKIW